ncbi:pilus assembly protein TadG-related protein [Sphingomonas turrisvirgatae]|uniref:Putative Flp pilus-assembly TadG-like N-terminal domain-containing protein n=1 Tax=Sphingomonas turrisvirgatae TaxID=1888892 RepID=A0A1E3LVC9_9SPHN|nr:pilus assembly protein TadG-related protein [Sphingomonas turrisvirgatae]ODP37708.1 hypothetical protein BFL28_01640 [Sphingomonas turrisvirgatae]
MTRARFTWLAADQGAIAPATAVLLAVLIGMVGLVTDSSVWYAQRRQLQAATDVAALAAAPYAEDAVAARDAANATLVANGLDPAEAVLTFATGQYCTGEGVGQRFRSVGCSDAIDTTGNAVRIETGLGSPLFLSRLFSERAERRISVVSTAARINQAGIEAGTGIASLNAGLANAVLSSLVGGSVSLSAAQYDGLLRTNVDALTFFDALATRLGVTGGTYEQLLQADVGVRDVIAAQIAALAAQGQVAEVSAAIAGLQALQGQIAGNPAIALGRLFDLGLWQTRQVGDRASTSALRAGINLMQLTSFSLQLADGNHFATVPASTFGIGNLASIRVAATAIEPPVRPYFAFGPEGTRVHSAQVRLKLELEVLNLVPQLGTGVRVPLYIEAASGDAQIDEIACSGDPARDTTVTVSANGGVANVYIGAPADEAMNNFSQPVALSQIRPVRILNLGLPGILTLAETSARAHVAIGSTLAPSRTLNFVQPSGTVSQPLPPTSTGVIGRPASGTQTASSVVRARATSTQLAGNLLGGLAETLSVRACTLSLLGGCLLPVTLQGSQVGALYTVLDPVLTGLDGVVDGLLRTLGVQLGYVDVAVTGVRCGHPVLVS